MVDQHHPDDEHELARLLELDAAQSEDWARSLSDAQAEQRVQWLKEWADRYWQIDPNHSVAIARLMIAIGTARGNLAQQALGTMALGDAFRTIGDMSNAASALQEAATLYLVIGDELGWARTRIGWLSLSIEINQVDQALIDAVHAAEIFERSGETEKLLRLQYNRAFIHNSRGEHQQARNLLLDVLQIAEEPGSPVTEFRALICNNLGYTEMMVGNFAAAHSWYSKAYAAAQDLNQLNSILLSEMNLAYLDQTRGRYRDALQRLYQLERRTGEALPHDLAVVRRMMIECHLALNRFSEARDLAQRVSQELEQLGAHSEQAYTLLHLATAEAELRRFAQAQLALDRAETIFQDRRAETWVSTVAMRRARIALLQGDLAAAAAALATARQRFLFAGQRVNQAQLELLDGQIQLAAGKLDLAVQNAMRALRVARETGIPALRYGAHLLLGKLAEHTQKPWHATWRYRAAAATVERVQNQLTITLRPGFLQDKDEALRALIRLQLQRGQTRQAWHSLEHAKSQLLLGYLANREHLRWKIQDASSRGLLEELEQLRREYQWLYRLAYDPPADTQFAAPDPQALLVELEGRERRLREISDRLFVHTAGQSPVHRAQVPALAEIQQALDDETLLLEFYNTAEQLYLFVIDRRSFVVYALNAPLGRVDQLLNKLQANINGALSTRPGSVPERNLSRTLRSFAGQLYNLLLQPIVTRLQRYRRLTIVPYGGLHYLPFHVLHNGTNYLIETHEVVVLPAAGLLTRRSPKQSGGARVLAHSWENRLPQTHTEARIITAIWGGELWYEQAATRARLEATPLRILHIAAHGEHRLNQPDLSYIQLGDGQLYTDDLLQQDLSYELVTLSACETGRARVAAGDELIGLGRGFLYAGAGALISSMWQLADDYAAPQMQQLYLELHAGTSKAAALRAAQRAALAEDPVLHPAFWGSFQLIGDPAPISPASP